ncbi:hypothetical protein BIW11_13697, partial [Tropilaelaps mercedesae]
MTARLGGKTSPLSQLHYTSRLSANAKMLKSVTRTVSGDEFVSAKAKSFTPNVAWPVFLHSRPNCGRRPAAMRMYIDPSKEALLTIHGQKCRRIGNN